jgi:hypothetical protein
VLLVVLLLQALEPQNSAAVPAEQLRIHRTVVRVAVAQQAHQLLVAREAIIPAAMAAAVAAAVQVALVLLLVPIIAAHFLSTVQQVALAQLERLAALEAQPQEWLLGLALMVQAVAVAQ